MFLQIIAHMDIKHKDSNHILIFAARVSEYLPAMCQQLPFPVIAIILAGVCANVIIIIFITHQEWGPFYLVAVIDCFQ